MTVLAALPCAFSAHAELLDRTAAIIGDQAITLSELKDQLNRVRAVNPAASSIDTIQAMINRVVLLRDAKKFRIDAATEDDIINQYINLKIRALIIIPDRDARAYYEQNRARFAGKDYDEVSADIMRYLSEVEINNRLRRHIEGLRKETHIIIYGDALP